MLLEFYDLVVSLFSKLTWWLDKNDKLCFVYTEKNESVDTRITTISEIKDKKTYKKRIGILSNLPQHDIHILVTIFLLNLKDKNVILAPKHQKMKVELRAFLTSALDIGEWSASHSSSFIPRENLQYSLERNKHRYKKIKKRVRQISFIYWIFCTQTGSHIKGWSIRMHKISDIREYISKSNILK
jgi:hypothetical protein